MAVRYHECAWAPACPRVSLCAGRQVRAVAGLRVASARSEGQGGDELFSASLLSASERWPVRRLRGLSDRNVF